MSFVVQRLAVLAMVLSAISPADAEPAPPAAATAVESPAPAAAAPKPEVPNSAFIPQLRPRVDAGKPAPASEAPAAAPATGAAAIPVTRGLSQPAGATPPGGGAVVAGDKERTLDKAVAPPPKPSPTVVIAVDLTQQKMIVSENGAQKFAWPISSGRVNGYQTPNGTFRPQWMAKMWHSRKYDDAPMPNSIFFTGGFAIHATAAYSQLGHPASHGCVRLSPTNAATLFKLVQKHGMDKTKIIVRGVTPANEPPVARLEARNLQRVAARAPARYLVQRSTSVSPLDLLFGSEPRRIVYGMPPVRGDRRPRYIVTQNGTVVGVR